MKKIIKLSSDNKITLPPEIIKELNIKSGDNIEFFIDNNCIILKKINKT